ncbi:PREDICTED: poliovirus receptor [Elephantulus edwardii]|uniref:poliovirus receptor n=1 Tax=Elephantulus edwardii TaxID=28737 RepID=UPI0003F0C213|nr:PREDICTED: poliovirus receptor [Elephantulus edwardii]
MWFKPQDLVEALEVRGPPHPDPVPAARCVSAGGHPPANISWSLPLNWQVNTSQAPGPLPGTDTVTSLLLVVPSSEVDLKNVTCVVDHAGFPAPHLLPVTLSVHYAPEVSILGYDDNWYIGRSEVTLNCDIRSNPEPTGYEWSTTGGPLPSFVVSQGHQIFIPAVNESVNTTFFCNATNAIGTGHAALTVLVRGKEFPG